MATLSVFGAKCQREVPLFFKILEFPYNTMYDRSKEAPEPKGSPIRSPVFTARCSASAVLAMSVCPSVCLFVRLSVTSRCSTKTAKRRITQTTPHDSAGTLVF